MSKSKLNSIDSRSKEQIIIKWFDRKYKIGIGDQKKVDLGCGNFKVEGFDGVDKRQLPGVNILHDLEKFPWPFKEESCSILLAHGLINVIKPWETINFFDECWRILEFNGAFVANAAYAGSLESYLDPMACSFWREETLYCFLADTALYKVYTPKPWRADVVSVNIDKTDIKFLFRKIHMI